MTNRIQYTEYQPPATKQQEIKWLADKLAAGGQPLTVENAQAALAQFRANAPGEWLLVPEDIPDLWAKRETVSRVSSVAEYHRLTVEVGGSQPSPGTNIIS